MRSNVPGAATGRPPGEGEPVSWLLGKVDGLVGTLVAGAGGLGAAQLPAFVHQYVQRLGGRIDEATYQLETIRSGTLYSSVSEATRDEMMRATTARVAELETARDAIVQAGPLMRPLRLFEYFDPDTVRSTLADFQPALPVELSGLVYGLAGLIIGLLLYDVVKLPLLLVRRRGGGRRRLAGP